MSVGSPIVFCQSAENRRFIPLSAATTRRDDPNAFDETLLQTLIDQSPGVLPIREFLPSATTLFSLAREVRVDIGGAEGRIDNLLVTDDGYLVIVETKLYRNPEATRAVVAQAMQYGMAIGVMRVPDLETCIRRGQSPALRPTETIRDCVSRLAAADDGHSVVLADDFDEAFERHLRMGEILLLVVSDGIHVGVQRLTDWLNGQGSSSPLKFGLVELKFYALGDQQLVIPRAVVKTREISRHVVMVDVHSAVAGVTATTDVLDEYRNASGGQVQESRSVKTAAAPLTRNTLLQLVASDDREAAGRLIDLLEMFDQQGTGSYLQLGLRFPEGGDGFHPLAYLGKGGIWVYPLKKDRDRLGDSLMAKFQRDANRFGLFYREDQIGNPNSSGCAVKYRALKDKSAFAAFLDSYRKTLKDALEAEAVQ